MKRNNAIRDSLNGNLSGLYVSGQRHAELMREIVGGRKMKKKQSVALVLAMTLILVAAAALAYTLMRSPQAEAVAGARQALSRAYGLTAETMGLFNTAAEKDGEEWTVTLTAASFPDSLLGEYRVVMKNGEMKASWSYDEADKALWQNGDLSSPIWAQPQMEKALRDRASADEYSRKAYAAAQNATPAQATALPIDPGQLKEGEGWWNGEIVRKGEPGPEDMPKEKALQLGYQALAEEFSLQRDALEAGTVINEEFYIREGKNPAWGFSIYIPVDGVPLDCGVVLDARTGEILLTNVITGANE